MTAVAEIADLVLPAATFLERTLLIRSTYESKSRINVHGLLTKNIRRLQFLSGVCIYMSATSSNILWRRSQIPRLTKGWKAVRGLPLSILRLRLPTQTQASKTRTFACSHAVLIAVRPLFASRIAYPFQAGFSTSTERLKGCRAGHRARFPHSDY